jgi:hypothetical protein
MKLKIDLKIDTKTFVLVMISLLLLFLIICSTFNLRWFEVHNYSNCTVRVSESPYYLNVQNWSPYYSTINIKCCYPTNCPQAKDNPKDCYCIYPVYCGNYSSTRYI